MYPVPRTKPTVRIRHCRLAYIGPSQYLFGIPEDHPDTRHVTNNGNGVWTSPVVEVDIPNGIIETQNTKYKVLGWAPKQHEEWLQVSLRAIRNPAADNRQAVGV